LSIKNVFLGAGVALVATTGAAALAPTHAQACDLDRDIVFGDLDWASAQFHSRVAQFILEEGYDCSTDVIPGSTLPIYNGMARGDVDITMEIWVPNVQEWWDEETAKGTVESVGLAYPDAVQGWFVPRYLVEGDDAPAAGLTSVSHLPSTPRFSRTRKTRYGPLLQLHRRLGLRRRQHAQARGLWPG
jgi:glycine betaine/proline transport system substrate-binding protein